MLSSQVNTSSIGHNLFNTTDDSSDKDDDDGGLLDDIKGAWDDARDKIEDKLNDITGALADELASTLGISEWYSIHVMDACEGNFKPNATSRNPGYNVTECSNSSPNSMFHLLLWIRLQEGMESLTIL